MSTRNVTKFLLTLKRHPEFTRKYQEWCESLVIFCSEMKAFEDLGHEMVRSEMNEHVKDVARDLLTLGTRCDKIENLAEVLQTETLKPQGEISLSWDERRMRIVRVTIDGRILVVNKNTEQSTEF